MQKVMLEQQIQAQLEYGLQIMKMKQVGLQAICVYKYFIKKAPEVMCH